MRNDVKLGLVLSLVVVVVAGWYFAGRGKTEKPLPIADKTSAIGRPTDGSAVKPAAKPDRVPTNRPKPSADVAAAPRAGSDKPMVPPSPPPVTPEPGKSADAVLVGPPPPPSLTEPSTGREVASEVSLGAEPKAVASPDLAVTDTMRSEKPLDASKATGLSPTPPAAGDKPTASPTTPTGVPGPIQLVSRSPGAVPTTPSAVRTHVVAPGDTIAILAEVYYGSQSYTGYLLKVNPKVDPQRLLVGTALLVPEKPGDMSVVPAAEGKKTASAAGPTGGGEMYTVRPGDSFYRIARNALGDESRWREVFDLNKDLVEGSPDHLKVGQVLKLPRK